MYFFFLPFHMIELLSILRHCISVSGQNEEVVAKIEKGHQLTSPKWTLNQGKTEIKT